MPELDRRLIFQPFYRPLDIPALTGSGAAGDRSRFRFMEHRLIVDTTSSVYVTAHINTYAWTVYSTTQGLNSPTITDWNLQGRENYAQFVALMSGARVTVGPTGLDGTVLPDRVRQVLIPAVDSVAFEPGVPDDVRQRGVGRSDRIALIATAPFPAGVGDLTPTRDSTYTWRTGDECTIEQYVADNRAAWCAVLSDVASDALLVTTQGDVEITDQRIDVRVRVRRDPANTPYRRCALELSAGGPQVKYEVISVAEEDDLRLGRGRFQILGLRRTQARSEG